ncbi:hypothetical protein FRC01_005508 [Tulasnella sp. 417]|nr:hypothetical protein FRC01_005508 [Tulasnella sp. 417]
MRKYSDMSGPSQHSSKTTPPIKPLSGIQRNSYKASVKTGFQATFEVSKRRKPSRAYQRAVKLGTYQGTFDAWRYEVAPRRTPGGCAYISTLSLDKVSQTGQLVVVRAHRRRALIERFVLVNGQSVGQANFDLHGKYTAPPGTLLKMYYDQEEHLLRFQSKDGEPLPRYTDVDLVSKAASVGYRPLLVLAYSEGLIPTVPDGYLPSLDLQTNTNSGYYIRANRLKTSPFCYSTILFPGGVGTTLLAFRPSEPEKFEYLRFFPYIHEDQTFRLWDVERGVDVPLKRERVVAPWEPQTRRLHLMFFGIRALKVFDRKAC